MAPGLGDCVADGHCDEIPASCWYLVRWRYVFSETINDFIEHMLLLKRWISVRFTFSASRCSLSEALLICPHSAQGQIYACSNEIYSVYVWALGLSVYVYVGGWVSGFMCLCTCAFARCLWHAISRLKVKLVESCNLRTPQSGWMIRWIYPQRLSAAAQRSEWRKITLINTFIKSAKWFFPPSLAHQQAVIMPLFVPLMCVLSL